MTTLEGHTSREIRGRIMKILRLNYPQQTGDKLIAEILLDAQYSTTPAAVETHLVYLREKGYIALEEAECFGVSRKLAKLLPKGIDLIEGNIPPDVGVNLNGEPEEASAHYDGAAERPHSRHQ